MTDPSRAIDEQLQLAIAEKRLIQMRYSGKVRVVEPHDYGVKKGAKMLLAYQKQSVPSSNKPAVGWRLFDLAKIEELRVLDDSFPGSRGEAHQQHHAWDVLYLRVK